MTPPPPTHPPKTAVSIDEDAVMDIIEADNRDHLKLAVIIGAVSTYAYLVSKPQAALQRFIASRLTGLTAFAARAMTRATGAVVSYSGGLAVGLVESVMHMRHRLVNDPPPLAILPAQKVAGRRCQLRPRHARDMVADVWRKGITNGTPVVLHAPLEGHLNQWFTFETRPDGKHVSIHPAHAPHMELRPSAISNASEVVLQPTAANWPGWQIFFNRSGARIVVADETKAVPEPFVLDVWCKGTANQTKLVIHKDLGGANQRFRILPEERVS